MSQQEVYKLLEKENKWMCAKEIAQKLKVSYGSIRKNLQSLHLGNFIKMKVIPNKKGMEVFYYKKTKKKLMIESKMEEN